MKKPQLAVACSAQIARRQQWRCVEGLEAWRAICRYSTARPNITKRPRFGARRHRFATSVEAEALARSGVYEFERLCEVNKKHLQLKSSAWFRRSPDFAKLGETVASHLARQDFRSPAILETLASLRGREGARRMESESRCAIEKRIVRVVNAQMEKTQREYIDNEQMKAIQKELGDDEGPPTKLADWKRKMPDQALQGKRAGECANEVEEAAQDVRRCPRRRPWCATI